MTQIKWLLDVGQIQDEQEGLRRNCHQRRGRHSGGTQCKDSAADEYSSSGSNVQGQGIACGLLPAAVTAPQQGYAPTSAGQQQAAMRDVQLGLTRS